MEPSFACPGCGRRYAIQNSLAGKQIRCPQCSTVFRIPATCSPDNPASSPLDDLRREAGPTTTASASQPIGAAAAPVFGSIRRRPEPTTRLTLWIAGGAGGLLVVLVVVLVLFAILRSDRGRSQPAPDGVNGNNAVAPPPPAPVALLPTVEVEEPVASIAAIPEPGNDKLTFARSPAKFVAISNEVYDLTKSAKAGAFKAPVREQLVAGARALSADGRWFAWEADGDHAVEIYDCRSGERVQWFRYWPRDQNVDLLQFTKHNHLIVVAPEGSSKHRAFVVRTSDGVKLREMALSGADRRRLAASDDGRLLAAADSHELKVFDVARGETTASMTAPPPATGGYSYLDGLRFSPDHSELAGLFTRGVEPYLVVWNLKGEVKEHHAVDPCIGLSNADEISLEWSPDGQGWLLRGNAFFDRRMKGIAWIMVPPNIHRFPHCWLDKNHVVATQGGIHLGQLVSVPVPRGRIDDAVQTLESGQGSLLRPAQRITLDLQIGETRFVDRNSVQSELQKLLTKRLAAVGVAFADSLPTVLHVKYSETAGERLQVVENTRPTGKSVQETVILLEMVLNSPDASQPIWQSTIRSNPRVSVAPTIDDKVARDTAFSVLDYELSYKTFVPSFIPRDSKLPQLPLVRRLYDSPD